MLLDNPILIQPGPAAATPLFLLHDGGGTIFNYFMLGDLDRPVYGIQDPKFGTADQWEGGMEEMARLYISFIRSAVPQGPILLGGWSLGGLTALEIARILAGAANGLRVRGLILIDSPLPEEWANHRDRFVNADVSVTETTSAKTKQAVDWRMDECDRLLDGWRAPRWQQTDQARAEPTPLRHQRAHGPLQHHMRRRALPPPELPLPGSPPPAVLLRATERVPVPAGSKPGSLVDVDLDRDSTLLGWDRLEYPLLHAVYDIPGHHFDIFEGHDRLDAITELLGRVSREMDV
ncbi:Alpha/Beta hydrolase protein [Aspergillus pseudoustus]|uniref:Alpha/Beta hydrolase protein n=1 Tax=Aspergillus pseudoustus TaxID=1810923 RepID=A0ABR4KFF3_9EURO